MNPGPGRLACVVLVVGWVSLLPAQEPAKEPPAWKYHEPFRGNPRQAKDFELLGAGATDSVKYEAGGVRIALPAGKSRPATGVATTFGLSGDFDLSVRYEILQEPEPADAGTPNTGTRISLTVKTDAVSEAAIRRKVTPKDPAHILAWRTMRPEGETKSQPKGAIFAVKEKKGRLRMERKGTEVTYYQSEGDDKEFKKLTTFAFVGDDVKAVQLFGETSSPKAALEVRFTDLHIAAKAVVPKAPAPVKPPEPPKKDPPPTAPAPANLASNGNFEEVKDGVPTGWFSVCNAGGSVTHKALAEGAKEGKYCHVKSKGEWAVSGSPKVPLDRTKTYTLTGFARVKSGTVTIKIDYYKGDEHLGYSKSDESTKSEWTPLKVVSELDRYKEATHILVAGVIHGDGEAFFDGFVLTAK